MRGFKFIVILFLLGCLRFSIAQIYPVQLSAQLIPPYSGYLPDYADPSSEKLKIILQFNDLTTPQYNIRLKLEIKGNGFTLVTKQLFNPPPISLQSGVPLLLSGADLAPYLNSNNLDFVGINQNQYEQRMALPEGYYSVCVKAYDYYNPGNIQVSNESCSQAWFLLNDPPFLNLPQCGLSVTPQNPQNLVFQWTPMHLSSPNSALNTDYEFALWEVRPDSSVNPNQVVLSTAPIFSTTTNQTIFNYGIAEPPLNLYMKYVWRVRAKDISGRDWFKNNGYSQICTFVYGNIQTVLGNAVNLTLNAEGVSHRLGKCTWNTQSIYTKYLLQVRKSGTQNWFDYNCTTGTEKVANLEPNTTYEARVRGEGSIVGDWSNIATFNTSSEPNYSCNDQTQYADVLAAQPLPANKATIGLIIQTGQFEVVTTQIAPSGPPGWYSGKGYAKVFGLLPLAVQFTNIYIDDNNRHQQGVIQAMTQGINNWVNQWDVKDAEENSTYINGVDSVYVSGNQVCVKIQGKISDSCFAFPPNQNVVVIRDDQGNQWAITVNPPPPTVTGPTNYYNFSNDELAAGDSALVVFERNPNQQYGFDEKKYTAWTNNYELIKLKNGNNYFVPYKSVAEFQSDEVYAKLDIKAFVASKLSFKSDNGTLLTSSAVNATSYKVTVPYQYKSVYAWYDGKKVGKLNVISLKSITKKLVIVPVGNASANSGNLQTELNKVYKQANVTWSVTTKPAFAFNIGTDLEMADATLMSKYSTEMRALRDAYKQATPDYDKDAYYVFVVNGFSEPSVKGYMVRGRALGFVASSGSAVENARVIAHELAHGAFGLEHTFPAIGKSTSENLLDYGNGKELGKVQWEEIKNCGFVCSWLDKEEDGSLNKDCHAGLTPSGKIFDECFDENGTKIDVTKCIAQGDYCIVSLLFKGEKYKWDKTLGFYVHKESNKAISVISKPKTINNKVNVFRILESGCSYQSTAIEWTQNIQGNVDIQAEIESKLTSSVLWDTDLFAGVKPTDCGASNTGELANCPSLPQNIESVTIEYLKSNFFAFSPATCLSGLPFKKRIQLVRNMLNNWAVTECLQNINPNIPTIGNCYEPLVYKLILSTPPTNEKDMFDSLVKQNLIYPLLNKTQYNTFDEVAKKLANWQIKYYPMSGEDAVKGKLEGNLKAVEFIENKVSGSVNPNGLIITRDGYGFCKECTPVSQISIQVPYTDYVLVNFKDRCEKFNAETKAKVPAIYALYLFNKDRREFLQSAGKLMFDVAMLGLGIGEIKAAYDAYRVGKTAYQAYIGIKALTDVGMALGDMVVNNALADSWKNTPEGRARLERWNNITTYWALGSISAAAFDAAITKYCNSSTKVVTSESKFDELADELEGIVNNGLVSYINVRNFLGNSKVRAYLNNEQLYVFETVLKKGHPDVLKYMDEMDEYDFVEMVRGYRDLINNNKLATFENAIKNGNDFYGPYGWLSYWRLTPSIKNSMKTIEDLRNSNKMLGVGNATDIQLASLQAFTVRGDFVNIPMRYNKSYLGEFAEKGYRNIIECMNELRKVPARAIKGRVTFSGKAFSKTFFDSKFVNGTGKEIEYLSFVSTSTLQSVAEVFADITKKWVNETDKVAIIQRIFVKDGVYIDDFSDWGKNLGPARHSDAESLIQIQEEVLLNPCKLKQIGEPIPIMENGQQKMINGMKAYYIDFSQ